MHRRKNAERHDHGGQAEHVRDAKIGCVNPPFSGGGQHKLGERPRDVGDRVHGANTPSRHAPSAIVSADSEIESRRSAVTTCRWMP